MLERVHVTRAELTARIEAGEIDTVLMVFPDLQGRLVGKRTTGRFFLEQVADEGTENCDYLIALDMDDNPVAGYRWASYEMGYGDMVARADWDTIRIIPWHDRTAMVICDLYDVDSRELVEVAPRTVLRRQVDAARDLGFEPMLGSEIEFHLFADSYDEAHAKGYRELTPHHPFLQDYQIATRDEYVIGRLRRALEAAGVPVEFSKGEAGRGQHEINLAYTTAIEMADRNHVYKTAAKEIAAAEGRAVSFMAKWDFAEAGSSCHIHSSLWSIDGTTACFAGDDDHGRHGMPDVFRHYLAGLVAAARDFSLLWAPTVNSYKRFQPGSWAPTGIGWGVDNRTLGFRVVGHGSSSRVECRIPGSDANSYFAFAGTIAAGLYGIRHELELGSAYEGNGYTATDIERIPSTLPEAIELWRGSAIARECFGDDVHHHVLTAAEGEWRAFNQAVTDWELRRYWERA